MPDFLKYTLDNNMISRFTQGQPNIDIIKYDNFIYLRGRTSLAKKNFFLE